MNLANFITDNMEPILQAWQEYASSLQQGKDMSKVELRDHAKAMLLAMAKDLMAPQSQKQALTKSKGEHTPLGKYSNLVDATAGKHALGRFDSGFSIEDLVGEFRALRASVLGLWQKSPQAAKLSDQTEINRFNESIDQALAESVSVYAKQKERNIRLFETVLLSSPDHNYILDLDGNFLYANKAMAEQYGDEVQQLIGKNIIELGLIEVDELKLAVKKVIQEKTALRGEIRYSQQLGKVTFYEYILTPIFDPDGEVEAIAGTERDVTERKVSQDALLNYTIKLKHAKAAAEEANLAKSEFLSSMSHELRTPLNAILGFAQLMESASPAVSSAPNLNHANSIKQILQAGWYLLDLINELLDLAQIESGKQHLTLEPVLINDIISELALLTESLCIKHGITMQIEPLVIDVYVFSDKIRLKQILINLISNAIKYNKKDGDVTVDFEIKNDFIKINVRDTGYGLTNEQLVHLFEPFNRLGQENKVPEGTGIGLVVSKKLIELMDGTIGVMSQVGLGSVFSISLKIITDTFQGIDQERLSKTKVTQKLMKFNSLNNITKDESECIDSNTKSNSFNVFLSDEAAMAQNNVSEKNCQSSMESKKKLLNIEDSNTNLLLIEEIFALRSEVELKSASSSQQGLSIATEWIPHVILLDINLDGMNGFEILKSLRLQHVTANIPVIAISANAMNSDIQKGLDAGFFRYLTKPIKINELIETLDEVNNWSTLNRKSL